MTSKKKVTKSPWFKYFVISSPPLTEAEKYERETKREIAERLNSGKKINLTGRL